MGIFAPQTPRSNPVREALTKGFDPLNNAAIKQQNVKSKRAISSLLGDETDSTLATPSLLGV